MHKVWLRLIGNRTPSFKDREHFFRTSAAALRRILIDRARICLIGVSLIGSLRKVIIGVGCSLSILSGPFRARGRPRPKWRVFQEIADPLVGAQQGQNLAPQSFIPGAGPFYKDGALPGWQPDRLSENDHIPIPIIAHTSTCCICQRPHSRRA